jgi:tetratricopeptide (TPR) repeat protein
MEHWEKGLEYSQDEPGPYMTMEWQLREVGRVDSSIDVIERAIGRFPDDPYFLDALAGAYSMKGWHDDVTDALARASALDPKRASRAATFIMWEKLISGAPEEALEALAGLKAANEIPRDDVCFATFVEARGAAAAGESVSDKIAVMKANCISKFWQARMYAALGDADGALENLKLYYDAPEWRSRTILFDPEMRRLRADPRFWELAVKLGLVDYWTSTDNWPDFCADPQYPVDCKALGQAAAKSTGSSARKP